MFGYTPYFLEKQAFRPSANPALVYELRPGYNGLYAGVPVSINSHGLRGPEPPPGHKPRVIVVGDSIAFGQAVRDNESLAAQLGGLLHEDVPNLGVPGYDTCQELERVREKGFPLQPALLVLLYCENDTDPSLFRISGDTVLSPDIRAGAAGDFMAALRKRSYFYNLAWTRWNLWKIGSPSIPQYQELMHRRFSTGAPGWRRSQSCLSTLIAEGRARNIATIVVPFPTLAGLDRSPYPFQEYIDAVCQTARGAGAQCIDVVPQLRDIPRPRASVVDSHPSPSVHHRLAVAIHGIFSVK